MESIYPAIVCVGYNRPDALKRLLESVGQADYPAAPIPLVVSIDKSDREEAVYAVADAFHWTHGEKIIRRFETRQGLKKHILQCGDLSIPYGAVIVLEDDLLVSPAFYHYAFKACRFYGEDPRLCGFALYSHAWNGYADYAFLPQNNGYDTYLGQFSITWGECWTSSQWTAFKTWYIAHQDGKAPFDSRIPQAIANWPETSWGKYFVSYLVERGLYYVIPYVSLSTNDEEPGQHAAGGDNSHQVMLLGAPDHDYRFAPIEEAVRYDIFFERMDPPLPAALHVDGRDVCVDLHGLKKDSLGKRYLLTTREFPLPEVARFGLRLRPIEANVILNVPGDSIRLYEAFGALPAPTRNNAYERMTYETYRLGWRRLLKYGLSACFKKLLGRIRRLF